jgi:hypothetical protein
MSVHLTAEARSRAIERIAEARFMLSAFEDMRRDPVQWACARNAMGRGIYEQALREKERLQGATDAQLCDELRAIAV